MSKSEEEPVYVYKNDFKYRNFRGIDYNRINEQTLEEHKKRIIKNYDTLEYRIKEFYKNGKKSLDLNCLGLKEFPKLDLDIVDNVRNIFCTDNYLEKIYDLSELKNLKVFDCSANEIEELPKLPKSIREIVCKSNKIKNIKILKSAENLTRIDCSNNMLTEIPNIKNLQILICSNNKINKIEGMDNLYKLICKHNEISELYKFEDLKFLSCEYNTIKKIGDYKKLEILICNDNIIEELNNINNIRYIVCYNNKLNKLRYFDKLENLYCDLNDEMKISEKYKIIDAIKKKQNSVVNIKFMTY